MANQDILDHAANVIAASREQRADAALRDFFKSRRLPAILRRQISQAVFAHFRWFGWLEVKDPPPRRIAAALALQQRFDQDPKSIKAEALAARAVPGWLKDAMDVPVEFLQQLQREPRLWLRARPGTGAALADALGHAVPFSRQCPGVAGANDAILYSGSQDLFLTDEFRAGTFEIQDLASQWVGWAAAPKPGETWWDACAGEGGKALHLADLMANKGAVWATDRSARRLEVLQRRAARAKLFNLRIASRPPRGPIFDGVLVDAPCSGIGTWQRNPHARWTTTPDDVRELAQAQLALLKSAAGLIKAGGRLVYSVCTLTRAETAGVAEAFSSAHPEFEALATAIPGETPAAPELAVLPPQRFGSNGMAVAAWRKK